MTKRKVFFGLLICTVIIVGLLPIFYEKYEAAKTEKNTLKIVTTTGMIGDVVRNIVKDKAEVVILMGPGVDPHTYEAGIQDAIHLTSAQLVFYNGLHLEGPMHNSLESLSKSNNVYAVSEAIDKSKILFDPEFSTGEDPHAWFDVSIWIEVTQFICEKLKLHDPKNANFYEENRKIYTKKLQKLHQDIQRAISSIPVEKRKLVASHDAFGYFGKAYHIEVKALQGLSTVTEVSTYKRIALKQYIKKNNIKAIYLEYSVDHKAMYSIQEDCAKIGHPIVCYEIYSDTIGQDGTEEGTYIGAMRHNLKMILQGLSS